MLWDNVARSPSIIWLIDVGRNRLSGNESSNQRSKHQGPSSICKICTKTQAIATVSECVLGCLAVDHNASTKAR
jgi:hypothetical protein